MISTPAHQSKKQDVISKKNITEIPQPLYYFSNVAFKKDTSFSLLINFNRAINNLLSGFILG